MLAGRMGWVVTCGRYATDSGGMGGCTVTTGIRPFFYATISLTSMLPWVALE